MNILLTGACGYIGSHVCDQMMKDNNIIVVDNLSTGFRNAISPNIKLYIEDLANTREIESIFRKHRIEAVIHFAGKISVPESVANPYLYYQTNTFNTLNLLNIASKCGVKFFIFSSTAAVYSQPNGTVHLSETDKTNPISPYGASKLMSERIIADIGRISGIKYAILRYFNVAGADPSLRIGQRNSNAAHLIKMCCKTVLGDRDCLDIFGTDYPTKDGTGVRDYIHVYDLAQAHLSALEYLKNGGISDIFNVGYSHGYSVLDIVDSFKRITNKDIKLRYAPRRNGDCAYIVADNSKILSKTNWIPRFNDIDLIVRHSYEFELRLRRGELEI